MTYDGMTPARADRNTGLDRADIGTDTGTKACRHCDTTKPLTEFNRDSSRDDGHQTYCRECQAMRWYLRGTLGARHLASKSKPATVRPYTPRHRERLEVAA